MNTERVNNQLHVHVPEYLGEDQNLLDQPPYNWLFEMEKIFPIDFFEDTQKGQAEFLRLYKTSKGISSLGWTKQLKEVMSPKYRDVATIRKAIRLTKLFFEDYPYTKDYLRTYWHGRYDFDDLGNPTRNSSFQFRTYAAYAHGRIKFENDKKLIGLEEVLPDSLSQPKNVVEALPSKGKANRWFRLKRSGALI